MDTKLFPTMSLKTSILLPLGIALVILILGFTYAYIHQERMYTQKYIGDQFSSAKHALDTAVEIETEKLSATLASITADSELKHAMMTGDRDALLKQSGPLFNTLREKYDITHFYFHRADRVNFLRVHKPDRYGDMINRFSILEAEATGEPASALEIGPLGLYTLRVVFPWYENKKLIGYVELGEEIEHIYGHIADAIDIDLFVLINKKILSRADWETGMKMIKRQAEWGLMSTSVIAFSTMPDSNNSILTHIIESTDHGEITVESGKQMRTFKTYSLPLTNAGQGNQEIGSMLFIHDVTDIKEQSLHNILRTVLFGSGIGGMLFLLFFFLTRQIISSKQSLVESEARFRSLVESSSDMIWEVDASGHYTYVSPKIKELLGYEVSEIIGKTPFERMTEEEAERLSEEFGEIVKERRPFVSLENTNFHKDGRIVIMESSGVPIINEDGILTGYRGVDRDITEWKLADEALKKVTERYVMHFEQSPLGIIEWDIDFKVAAWNPAAESIFGYTKEEAMERKAEELILAENVKIDVGKTWAALLVKEGGYRSTNENVTKEGNLIICKWYNTPLADKNGQVIGVTSVVEDVTEQKFAEQRILHMVHYDALTGLPNRILLQDRLEQDCRIADRNKRMVAVILMDMNNLKSINDTLGHQTGDILLKEVAARLKECFRASDTVTRFSGDQFAVIIPELAKQEDIEHVIQSVLDRFKAPFIFFENEFFVTFSIGVSYYPIDDTNAENLLRNADTAMYDAKDHGKNLYQNYTIDMTNKANINLSLMRGLRRALKEEEFVLYYQPQIDLKSGLVIGVEALIRWQDPEKGMISPDQFIPVAEETGLIVPMGEWIIQTACEQAKSWQEQGLPPMTMAINLSSREFKEEGFSKKVIHIIHETGLETKYVELELTESILIEDGTSVIKALDDFKKEGIRLSIDDFGTGYSSLSYLKHFPIDKLKIDQSFIRDLTVDKNDATLVRAIISMALALGLKTIAEGVETQEQLDFLRNEGCEEIQGYLLGRPMPAEQLEVFLKNR